LFLLSFGSLQALPQLKRAKEEEQPSTVPWIRPKATLTLPQRPSHPRLRSINSRSAAPQVVDALLTLLPMMRPRLWRLIEKAQLLRPLRPLQRQPLGKRMKML